MGLCLYVFDSNPEDDKELEEIAMCYVGSYEDFGCFRDAIARHLDSSLYPTLMLHTDCGGEWSLAEIPLLEEELREIGAAFRELPPEEPSEGFECLAEDREGARSLYDCFLDADGENLFEAILGLCEVAREYRLPVTFL